MPAAVEVEGLRETISSLRTVDRELPGVFRQEVKEAAGAVVQEARRRYRRRYRQRTGRHARRIRARASQRSAAVLFGGARLPEAGGQEFGSARRRQFGPRVPGGAFLNPAARAEAPRFARNVETALTRLIRRAEGR